jgi:hypothetical protein
LAKSSCGLLPHGLHQKVGRQKINKKKILWLIVGHLENDIESTQIFFNFFSNFFPDGGARLGGLFD